MKKNLKKVISAVIAMAVAGSLIPASFAAKVTLTDVAETAPYATAVNTLVALDVINGYEDDTFLPDNKITRAEVTKVVVAALNQTESAEGQTGATGFADVAADFWANGYINAGVQMGFINGMENNTFAPQDNVTFAQIAKMLVSSLGYEDYAQYMGGWPNGYLAIANQAGITDGVKASANDAVTRAQVAQMVYNALNTPIVENTGLEWDGGKLVPTIEKQDGKKDDVFYKSILTENFDAYLIEGYVVDEGVTEKDEVNFAVAKTLKYEGAISTAKAAFKDIADSIDTAKGTANNRVITAKVGDTNAADYQGAYAVAIVMINEFGENIILSFMPSGKNKSVKVDADLIDDEKGIDDDNLWIFASESADNSKKYPLKKNDAGALTVNVYVNGYKVCDALAGDTAVTNAINTYVLGADAGKVELVDTYRTDGYYDTIYAEKYITAVVGDVVASDSFITLKNIVPVRETFTIDGVLSLDTEEDEDLEYKIIYNGQEISLAELKKDDVLSIICDVANQTSLANCDDLVIYVSRDVQSGKVSAMNSTDKLITIGGTAYSFVKSYSSESDNFGLGDEYEISLDIFGRIVTYKQNTSTAKYAIVDRYIVDDDGDKLQLYTADGAIKTIILEKDANLTVVIPAEAPAEPAEESPAPVLGKADIKARVGVAMADRAPIEDRVIKYEINTQSGKIKEVEFIDPDKTATEESYKESRGRIGDVRLGASTKVVDAIEYYKTFNSEDKADATASDFSLGSIDSFNETATYTVYAFDLNNKVHSFVIVVKGEADYTADARFAVVTTATSVGEDEVGETIYTFKAYTADSQEAIVLTASAEMKTAALALNPGDVIVYKKATNGYIDDIQVLNDFDELNYTELVDAVIAGTCDGVDADVIDGSAFSGDWMTSWNDTRAEGARDNDAIQVLMGIVVEPEADGQIALARGDGSNKTDFDIDESKSGNTNGVYAIDVDDDTAVYKYDFSKRNESRFSKTVASSITASIIPESCLEEDDTVINWTKPGAKSNAKLALVKVVDGVATDVLYIVGEYDPAE